MTSKKRTTSTNTKRIHSFKTEGTARDVEWITQNKNYFRDDLMVKMRNKGYVPYLDRKPKLYVRYLPEKEIFRFAMRAWGVYIGKVKAQKAKAIRNGVVEY